ncbi:E3 ubiquitin-protein ligase TRIM71-like [Pollicipes pollicipes]|uniref:E3 ubiquitin-protein ligase TRIM71-like n=1 Tax=Pollicipes pollicipes TaxID=41117 RepID=UPI0018849A3C|nr:E3 ubiquitin-protein ligase TRIM71-like [Pollicipes pollicipes]
MSVTLCGTCDDTSVSATFQCVECNDYLCYTCACAHRRMRVTRSHTVLSAGGRHTSRCSLHQAVYTMVCSTCELPLCYACAMDHAEHSLDTLDGAATMAQQRTRTTQQEAQAFLAALAEARHRAVSTAELVRERAARAQLDAAAAGDKLRVALAAWQQRLKKKAAAVCQLKVARLHQQSEQLDQLRGRVLVLLEQLTAAGGGEGDAEQIVRGLTADHQLHLMMTQAQLTPAEDAATAGCGAQSLLLESAAIPVVGRPYQLVVQVRDHYGDERRAGDDRVQARVVTPDRRLLSCDVQHLAAGRYRAAFVARAAGEHTFSVTVNGEHLAHSPWTRRAISPRRLSSLGPVRLTVGSEGTDPGQLCRPWGVAFGADGRLVVSDRSNHRVQVFAADGRLLLAFGGPGSKNGELNRPAGVAVDSADRIIVADKDNHRVCVFTAGGEFVLKFGDKGNRLGMFNYPWDVACNALDQIAVTDTRNHRVQLFSPEGLLLKKFAQDGADWKELDSPRGLTFHPDGKLYITDFNNHRIVALDPETGKMTYLCREGTEPGRLLRPQGIAADDEGRLYVADCRNSRVQVLTPAGECLMKLGEYGSRPGQFDQPQGVAVGPSGQLAVVCLENHRVQLF